MRASTTFAMSSLTGVLLAIGFPPQPLGFLAWVAFAPLYAALTLARPPPLRSFSYGLVGGLGIGVVGVWWLIETTMRFVELGVVPSIGVWLAFSVYEAMPFALWGLALALGPKDGKSRIVFATASFVAIEHVFPTAFDFHSAVGVSAYPAWIQTAELGGAPAVVLLLVLTGTLLGHAAALPRHRVRLLVMAGAVPALATVFGIWRIAAVDAEQSGARTVRVGIVQPNTPIGWDDKPALMEELRATSHRAADEGAQVIVWPESSYPWGIEQPFTQDFAEDDDPFLGGLELPFVVSATTFRDDDTRPINSAFYLSRDGTVQEHFEKVHLIPFGERIPVVDPDWAMANFSGLTQYIPGDGPRRFAVELPDGSIAAMGPMICYEDNIDEFGRAVAGQADGVHAFVNMTNDAWFGQSWEPWEHLGLATFRTVEHRVPMIRSVNTGVSAVVDAAGRVTAHTEVHADSEAPAGEVLVADVALPRDTASAPTPYARGGWLLPWVLLAATAAWIGVLRIGRRRSSSTPVKS